MTRRRTGSIGAQRAWATLALVGAAACGGTTDPGASGTPVVGSWSYAGQQLSPAATTLTGVLTFNSQTGAQIAGSLDVVETDARGLQRRLAGPLAGRTADATTLDFEIVLGAASRRHVGRVSRDSLTGSWIETGTNGLPTASGTFRAAHGR